MFYVCAAILIVLCFLFPRNKIVTVAFLLFMWIMFAFNCDNADFRNYQNIYRQIRANQLWVTSVDEEGFIYLCRFCSHTLQLTYAQFLILYSTVCTILLGVVAHLYTKNCNIVLALFLFYSYWAMICQVRSYLSTLFVLIGFYFLIYRDDKYSPFLFFFFIILGGLFHRTALFFLPFYIIKVVRMKMITYVTAGAFVGFLMLRVPVVTKIVGLLLSQEKINNWLLSDGNRSIIGIAMLFIVRALLVTVLIMMFYPMKRGVKYTFAQFDKSLGLNLRLNGSAVAEYDVVLERVIKIAVLSFSFVALEAFVKDYERLFRPIMFLSYTVVAEYSWKNKVSVNRVPLGYLSFYAFFMLYMAYYLYAFFGWIEGALRPAFECNLLLR